MNNLAMHSYPLLFQPVKETITWIIGRIVLTHETKFFVKVALFNGSSQEVYTCPTEVKYDNSNWQGFVPKLMQLLLNKYARSENSLILVIDSKEFVVLKKKSKDYYILTHHW